jgi:hypothetical protein
MTFPGLLKSMLDQIKPELHIPTAFQKCVLYTVNLAKIPATESITKNVDASLPKKLEESRFNKEQKHRSGARKCLRKLAGPTPVWTTVIKATVRTVAAAPRLVVKSAWRRKMRQRRRKLASGMKLRGKTPGSKWGSAQPRQPGSQPGSSKCTQPGS